MAIKLPKDAKGREIPLDVDALYDKNGERLPLFVWIYTPRVNRKWTVQFLFDDSNRTYDPEDYFLTPPDSWEKLEEDLDRCIKEDCLCPYNPSEECSRCVLPIETENHCNSIALKEIKERIRKLRGESDA